MTETDVQDEKIKDIKDRTYAVEERTKWLEQHYNNFNSEMGKVQTDVAWIKRFMWWIAGLMITGFAGIASILIELSYRIK